MENGTLSTSATNYALVVDDLNFDAAGSVLTLNGSTVTINGNVNMSGGTFNTNTSAIGLAGNWTVSGGTLNVNTSTVTLTGANAQTINSSPATDFYNFSLNKTNDADTVTLGNTLNISNACTLTKGTLDSSGAGNYTLNVDAGLSIGANATLIANNSGITITGDWANAGTFTAGGSTVTFDGASAAFNIGPATFYNLTLNKGTSSNTGTLAGALTVSNLLTLTSGILTTSGSNFALNLKDVSSTSANATLTLNGSPVTITGNMTFSNGTLNMNTSAIDLAGNWTGSAGTINVNTSTLTCTGAGAQSLGSAANPAFYNVTLNKTNNGDTVSLASTFAVGGALTLTKGALDTVNGTNYAVNVGTTVSIAANG